MKHLNERGCLTIAKELDYLTSTNLRINTYIRLGCGIDLIFVLEKIELWCKLIQNLYWSDVILSILYYNYRLVDFMRHSESASAIPDFKRSQFLKVSVVICMQFYSMYCMCWQKMNKFDLQFYFRVHFK